jgi:dsRNA-specific ribonuclease
MGTDVPDDHDAMRDAIAEMDEAAPKVGPGLIFRPLLLTLPARKWFFVLRPQALADVFESVVGAVYVDTGYNLVAVWRFLSKLMKPLVDSVRRIRMS